MPFTKTTMMTVVVCLAVATVADADQRRGRGRSRGGDDRVVVQPRVVVRRPIVAERHAIPRGRAPFGARLAYRPVHRPGLGIGIYIGSPYRYGYVSYGRPYYSRPYPYSYRSYGYPVPYGYAAPYSPPYPTYPSYGGVYAVPPPDALYGGVRLDVTPVRVAQPLYQSWPR